VIQEIVAALQEIFRAELRLARIELSGEARKMASGVFLFLGSALFFVFVVEFLLFSLTCALAFVLPLWAAGLVMAGGSAVVAGILALVAIRRFRRLNPVPPRTAETMKENWQWISRSKN